MRKAFFWFGIVAACLAGMAAAGFGYLAVKGLRLDHESQSFANNAVFAITAHWDSQALLDRASPALFEQAKADRIAAAFEAFAVLGPLTGSDACQGQSSIVAIVGRPPVTTALYSCREQYREGAATIVLALVKLQDGWKINGFHVTSPLMQGRKAVQKA